MLKAKFARYLLVALLMNFVVSGCATTETTAQPDFCATAQPIYISKFDVISDETAREILKHNITGRNLCGWGKAKELKK